MQRSRRDLLPWNAVRSGHAAADLPDAVPAEFGLRDQLLSRIRQYSRQGLRSGGRMLQLYCSRASVQRQLSLLPGVDLHHDRRDHELREAMLRRGRLRNPLLCPARQRHTLGVFARDVLSDLTRRIAAQRDSSRAWLA